MNTIKNIMIIIGSIVAGSAVIYLAESLGHKLYPLPEGIDVYDSVAMKEYIFSMPLTGFVILLVGYELGGFGAGFFAALLSPPSFRTKNALIAGSFLTVGSAINLILIPHPVWFNIISMMVFIPFSLLGAKLSPMLRKQ
jgi:hypothetical protein